MTKYVLSIDGGGVRGLASATFLSELDKSTNKKLSELTKEIPKYYSTPEMRIECLDDEAKFKITEKI